MAKVEHTANARVLVGTDVSKHRHEVLISVPGKTRRRPLTITNTLEDFQRPIALLSDYHLPVQIGFEGQGARTKDRVKSTGSKACCRKDHFSEGRPSHTIALGDAIESSVKGAAFRTQ